MIVEQSFERLRNRLFNKNNDEYEEEGEEGATKITFQAYKFPLPIVPKLFYFLLFYCFGGYRPFVPLYLQSIDFTPSFIGFTLAFPPFISFLASPIWSATCDKYKCHRQAVMLCSGLSSILLFLLYFVDNHFIVFWIILINALFWAPLIPILDSSSMKILSTHRDLYGKQRMFGSIGFAVSATCIGLLAQHMDNLRIYWVNYPIAMILYMICIWLFYYDQPLPQRLMSIKFDWYTHVLDAIKIRNNSTSDFTKLDEIELGEQEMKKDIENEQTKESILINNDNNNNNENENDEATLTLIKQQKNEKVEEQEEEEEEEVEDTQQITKKESSINQPKPSFIKSLGILLSNYRLLLFLLNAFIVAIGMAMNNNFLGLVIVNDFKGPSSLVGVSSILNVSFELVFFFFGKQLLEKFGTNNLIILSHVSLIIRVGSYMFLLSIKSSAWSILPVELLHGIIFASIWSAGCKICIELAPPGLETTSQSLLFAIYLGLGNGLGAYMGGAIYQASGPIVMYAVIAIMTLLGLVLFLVFQYLTKKLDQRQIIKQQLLKQQLPPIVDDIINNTSNNVDIKTELS